MKYRKIAVWGGDSDRILTQKAVDHLGITLKKDYRVAKNDEEWFGIRYGNAGYDGKKYFLWHRISSLFKRDDEKLIKMLEELGKKASVGGCFQIVEIPFDVEWEIVDSDYGNEYVGEKHRTWFPKKFGFQP